jgi:hypothetical protein
MFNRGIRRTFSFTELHKKQFKRTKFINHNKLKFTVLERQFLPTHLRIEHFVKNHKIKSFLYTALTVGILYWDWPTCKNFSILPKIDLEFRVRQQMGGYGVPTNQQA